jgi:nucleoid DNA-binding protein
MTLTERVEAIYAYAQEKGLVTKDAEGNVRPFTKADARAVIDFEDKGVEEALMKGDTVKTSYGILKKVHRKERTARNPRDKEAPTFIVPAYDTIKITATSAFEDKLNGRTK